MERRDNKDMKTLNHGIVELNKSDIEDIIYVLQKSEEEENTYPKGVYNIETGEVEEVIKTL